MINMYRNNIVCKIERDDQELELEKTVCLSIECCESLNCYEVASSKWIH